MSRIHDALKKAQQERDLVAPTGIESAQPEPSTRDRGDAQGVVQAAVEEATGRATTHSLPLGVSSTEFLRFDDLVERCAHPHWRPDSNANVFTNSSEKALGAEQFRTLRSRLYQLRNDQPLRTILVTSAVAAEGKTFVANNLAQSIVRQVDRRVLLIDADLRRARLHVPLGAPGTPGLTDYLQGRAAETDIVQCGRERNLCLIAGGTEVSNPSELLSNGRLKSLLERIGPLFDWVIVDSPPCVPVADATMIAGLCDAVLLVVRAGSTPSELSQKAAQELQGRNVVGVVMNGVEERDGYGKYYYYSHYGPEASKTERPAS